MKTAYATQQMYGKLSKGKEKDMLGFGPMGSMPLAALPEPTHNITSPDSRLGASPIQGSKILQDAAKEDADGDA